MNRAIGWITVVVLLGPVGSTFAQAPCTAGMSGKPAIRREGAPCAMGGGIGARVMFLMNHPELAEKVGLAKDDMSALRTITFNHRSEMIDLHANAQRARLNLEQAKTADKPDAAAVEKAIDEAHSIEAEIEKAKFRYQQQVRAIISEERLRDLREEAMKALGEFRRERVEMRGARREGTRGALRKSGRGGKRRTAWRFGAEGDEALTPQDTGQDDEN